MCEYGQKEVATSRASSAQEAPIAFEFTATQAQEVLDTSSEPKTRDPLSMWPSCA